VAVSGGVDSMVLLDVLVRIAPRLPLALHAAHIHHDLRGRSADRDAAAVSAAAASYGLAVSVERLDATTRPRGTSVEVWARDQRYARLEAIRRRVRAAWVLTAHTENDQAETVLLNLLRGAGPRGLAGIPRTRERIVRPLLDVPRSAIAAYAATHGVRFRDDPSNRNLAYRRNRIRWRLLPVLARDYNPRIVASLAALAGELREDDAALDRHAVKTAAGAMRSRGASLGVNVGLVRAAPPAIGRRVFQEAFRRVSGGRRGLTRRHVAALRRLANGRGQVSLPDGIRAWAAAKYVWLGPAAAGGSGRRGGGGAPAPGREAEVTLRPGRWSRWGAGSCLLRIRRVIAGAIPRVGGDRHREILSPRVLTGPVSVRGWRPGDRFQPLGLAGTKKLQDFFVDAKIPREARGSVPLLVAGSRIAWVVGHRIADEFRWAGERTACLAEVRFRERARGVPARPNAAVGR
jgi:tRNA(Ile)-lysidine synthase